MHARLFRAAAFLLACQAAALPSPPMICQDILIAVDVSANNKVLPPQLSLADLTPAFLESVVASVETTVTGGQFTIGARYCKPATPVPQRQQTLQVLVHGVTYTRNYWSGLAAPGTKPGQDAYSWIVYAAQQGYPTLSVDRLCNGASSHPDGVAACQLPLEAEALHAVIGAARAGQLPGISTAFTKIIVAAHSYGSLVMNDVAIEHPADIDALLLTGFSFAVTNGLPGVLLPLFSPAAVVDPGAFGTLDPSYLAAASELGAQQLFYFGQFDPALVAYDFAHRGTLTVGELATLLPGQQPAPVFAGPLLVLNGNEDAIFCQSSVVPALLTVPGNCSAGFDQGVGAFYPAAAAFDFVNTPETGHCLNGHLTAQQSFAAAHQFLQGVGF